MIRFKYIDKIPPILRNRYILTILIFLLWIFLLDTHNLIARLREMKELKNLKADKEYYTRKIREDKRKLQELKTDNSNLEKFAREQYRMKKPDEDLYIILTPQEERDLKRKNH